MKWKTNDTMYPSGWMFGTGTGTFTSFQSPEGIFFKSSAKVLRFLIENNYPESDIVKMRKVMHREGWEEKEALPAGWLFRKRTNGMRKRRNEFCDAQGRYLKSGAEVLTYSKYYTQDVIDKLQNFTGVKK